MEEKHKIMGIMGLIALRKSELYYKVFNKLTKERKISEMDNEKIKKYISEMDNERLLSKEEKESKKIRPELNLDDIDLDIEHIIKEIDSKF